MSMSSNYNSRPRLHELMIDKDKNNYLFENSMINLNHLKDQAILMRLESDITDIFLATINSKLSNLEIKWKNESACTIVLHPRATQEL